MAVMYRLWNGCKCTGFGMAVCVTNASSCDASVNSILIIYDFRRKKLLQVFVDEKYYK